jgi:RHH-type transcriptional regulator, rel operon repressor / antitoxin RelB
MPSIVEKSLSVRLPIDLANQLDSLTKFTGRTKSFLTVEALKDYLHAQTWQIEEIKKGIAEADRGEFASEAEVTEFFAKYAD